jgi:hypothetical protein
VRRLVDERREARNFIEVWDGIDDEGRIVASGVYFCRLKTVNHEQTRKMTLLR